MAFSLKKIVQASLFAWLDRRTGRNFQLSEMHTNYLTMFSLSFGRTPDQLAPKQNNQIYQNVGPAKSSTRR